MMAQNWEKHAESIEHNSVELSDIAHGEVLALQSCAEEIKQMCDEFEEAAKEGKMKCPACNAALMYEETADLIEVWCSNENCPYFEHKELGDIYFEWAARQVAEDKMGLL